MSHASFLGAFFFALVYLYIFGMQSVKNMKKRGQTKGCTPRLFEISALSHQGDDVRFWDSQHGPQPISYSTSSKLL